MARRDGGPAFPRTGYYPDMSGCGRDHDAIVERMDALTTPESGMSLRAYLAAHSPGVPEWFSHVPHPNKPPPPPTVESVMGRTPDPNEVGYEARSAWVEKANRLGDELEPQRQVYLRRFKAWEQADRTTRLAQWAWAYADALLATMDGIPCDPPTVEEAMAEVE